MSNDARTPPFRKARLLGYAGLLPQVIALVLFTGGGEWSWIALAAGFAYAALIFSFLGGAWWGQALTMQDGRSWIYLAAVVPSLLALALFLPWTLGWPWPGPSMFWLGLLIMASPLIDRQIDPAAHAWLRLRWHLSIGLGALTFVLGILSLMEN